MADRNGILARNIRRLGSESDLKLQIFLACASIDMVSLFDQTALTVALPIIATRLTAGSESIWYANGYFV
jgi:hypothetical protein